MYSKGSNVAGLRVVNKRCQISLRTVQIMASSGKWTYDDMLRNNELSNIFCREERFLGANFWKRSLQFCAFIALFTCSLLIILPSLQCRERLCGHSLIACWPCRLVVSCRPMRVLRCSFAIFAKVRLGLGSLLIPPWFTILGRNSFVKWWRKSSLLSTCPAVIGVSVDFASLNHPMLPLGCLSTKTETSLGTCVSRSLGRRSEPWFSGFPLKAVTVCGRSLIALAFHKNSFLSWTVIPRALIAVTGVVSIASQQRTAIFKLLMAHVR